MDINELTVAPVAKKRGRPANPNRIKPVKAEIQPENIEDFLNQISNEATKVENNAPVEVKQVERPVMREDLRMAPREEDPRTRAARRAAEVRDHLGNMDAGPDDFYIDPKSIPTGWDYEWKRHKVLGQEDPAYMVQTARMGWEPVPANRHPEFMPSGYIGNTIERKGMILMERPKELSDEARQIELKKARNQIRQKEAQLNSAEGGQFGRSKSDGTSLVKVNKSYEAIPIPKD